MSLDPQYYADDRGLIRLATVSDPGHRRQVERGAQLGDYVRLARGVYLAATLWGSLSLDAQYRARVHATATGRLHAGDLLCGPSAVALWRLPRWGSWPQMVHVLRTDISGGRRSHALVRHVAQQKDEGAEIDGLRVTSLARTVCDTAATHAMVASVMAADAALRGLEPPQGERGGYARAPIERDELIECASGRPVRRGQSRALHIARFADARSASAGESLLRVTLHRLGIAPPELQVHFVGDSGRDYLADFYWPGQDFILEFDGKNKYTDPALRNGRTAEEVVFEEKLREDELRAKVHGMTRADWHISLSTSRLEARLRAAGFDFGSG